MQASCIGAPATPIGWQFNSAAMMPYTTHAIAKAERSLNQVLHALKSTAKVAATGRLLRPQQTLNCNMQAGHMHTVNCILYMWTVAFSWLCHTETCLRLSIRGTSAKRSGGPAGHLHEESSFCVILLLSISSPRFSDDLEAVQRAV